MSRAAVFAGLGACWTGTTDSKTPSQPPPADAAVASEPDAASTPDEETGLAVHGVVSEAGTGVPLSNASVQLVDSTGSHGSANSGDDGRFRIAAVAGDYQLVVRYSDGYAVGSAQVPVTIHDQAERVDVSVQLLRRKPMPKPYGAPPARRRIV